MKKNSTLNICVLILFWAIISNKCFCQTQCITSVNGDNNNVHFVSLTDSGSAVSQNFSPSCNGNLSSFSFNYKVIQNESLNSLISFPTDASGNPYFVVDFFIYELSDGQSISSSNISDLKLVYSKPNIEATIVKPNPNEDFKYITIATNPTPLYSDKLYCLVIQLNTNFCNNLIAQKRTKLGSSYSPPVIGLTNLEDPMLSNLKILQKNICNIQFATRDFSTNNASYKELKVKTTFPSLTNGHPLINSYIYDGYYMHWENALRNLVFAINVTPFLPDIQGSNILCPISRITLTNAQPNGTWTIDNPNIATIENQNGGTVSILSTFPASKGLLKVSYTTRLGTTSKLIRVVNDDKPTITTSASNDGTPCQNQGFELTGVAVNNKALLLDGKSWAQMPTHPALGLTNKLTLEAWVYCSNPAAAQTIISKGNYDQEMGHYSLALFNNKIQFSIQTQPGYVLKSPIRFDNAAWHHVAGSYDGTTMRLYIDGKEVSKLDVQAAMIPNNGLLYIGQLGHDVYYQNNGKGPKIYPCTYRMNGQIDEVRIWNVCRSASDIQNNMYKTVSANNTGLVGYYKFNEPASIADPRIVLDYSGSLNNGYLYSSNDNSVTSSPNCTAQKVNASIKFGDFSYLWNNNSTQQSIQPYVPQAAYSYSVIDSATGCKATSDFITIKMNTNATEKITIPTNTQMPFTYTGINGNSISFAQNDFIDNQATKNYNTANINCVNNNTIIVTKADCPVRAIKERGGSNVLDLSNIQICTPSDQLPIQINIMANPLTNGTELNRTWSVTGNALYNLTPDPDNTTREDCRLLTLINAGNLKITYNYSLDGKTCTITSDITIAPVEITITSPAIAQNNKFNATPTGGVWRSGDRNNVLAVNPDGTITAIGRGKTNVTYTLTNNNNQNCFRQVEKSVDVVIP